jgi:hypothetical protein
MKIYKTTEANDYFIVAMNTLIEILFRSNVDSAVRYLASEFGVHEEYRRFAKSVITERLMLVAELESAEEWVNEITDGEWQEMTSFQDVIELYQMDMYMDMETTNEDEE